MVDFPQILNSNQDAFSGISELCCLNSSVRPERVNSIVLTNNSDSRIITLNFRT